MMKFYSKVNSMIFKSISSIDYLKILRANRCKTKELESVHGILFKYDLQEEVVNVILHYIITFRKTALTDEVLEDYAIEFVVENIKTSEEAIRLLEKKETERRLKRALNKAKALDGLNNIVPVQELLVETFISFKKRCNNDQKKTLITTMNQLINDTYEETQIK